jgi:hypothetical protein
VMASSSSKAGPADEDLIPTFFVNEILDSRDERPGPGDFHTWALSFKSSAPAGRIL